MSDEIRKPFHCVGKLSLDVILDRSDLACDDRHHDDMAPIATVLPALALIRTEHVLYRLLVDRRARQVDGRHGGIADRKHLLADTQGVARKDVQAKGQQRNQKQTAHVALAVIQKPESGRDRWIISSGVLVRPSTALRCGKRPKRAITSRCCRA